MKMQGDSKHPHQQLANELRCVDADRCIVAVMHHGAGATVLECIMVQGAEWCITTWMHQGAGASAIAAL